MSEESSVRIRSMMAADLDRVVEIAAALDDAPQWPRRVYESVLASSSPRRIAFVAEDSGTGAVVGFVVASLIAPEAEVETIVVAAGFQRRGVARRLFEAMADDLGRSQVREVLLEVRQSNVAAQGFYRSVGFVEEGRRPGYYADPIEDAVLMRLRFNSN
jgi:[ribosomal protein S18]-alanine N-acetyltransferase